MNQDFETLREEMEQALGGLDDAQTQLRPGGDLARWSIQETVEHLLLTYAATASTFDKRIAKGTGTRSRPTFAQRVGQEVVIRAGLFPAGRKAPELVTPSRGELPVPSGVLIERVSAALKHLDLRMVEAEKMFGAKQRAVSHMILGPLSISQWRRFHLIHARHHMKGIGKVRREFGV